MRDFFIRVVLLTIFITSLMLVASCSSLKPSNMIKTGVTTAVTYAVAGPIPAVANLAVSVGVDEVLPEEPQIDQIETKEQSAAYIADSLFMNSLYAFIAFLLITNLAVPYFTRKWGYNKAKEKYKRRHDD